MNKEDLETTALIKILDEIHHVSLYQDGIMLLVRQETNDDVRLRLLREYDKAEEYYKMLNEEIYRRWGFDCERPFERTRGIK